MTWLNYKPSSILKQSALSLLLCDDSVLCDPGPDLCCKCVCEEAPEIAHNDAEQTPRDQTTHAPLQSAPEHLVMSLYL